MTLNHPGLSGLVINAQRGDVSAREDLARRCQRSAFVFALHLTGNPEDARDITQDALLRLFASLDRFDTGRPVNPWLLRIVRNLVYDRSRRSQVRRNRGERSCDTAVIVEAPDSTADPEALATRREMQLLLWRGVQQLPEQQREVLVLRDYQDLSYAEIAEVLGIARGTVMSRLHRARLKLRNLVQPGGEANNG